MASTKEQQFRVPTGGIDRSQQSFLLDPGSFQVLLNLRPDGGQLNQTPLIYPLFSNFTTYNSVASGTVRALKLLLNIGAQLRYFSLDESHGRFLDPSTGTQVQVPFVLQTAVPNRSDITGQCLLYGISTLGFLVLNTSVDIQIVDSTHFKYQQSGGGYSASLLIGPAVALGVTGMYASFLATSGYTAGDTWTWTRTLTPYQGVYPSFQVQTAFSRRDCYFAGYDRHVLRLRDNMLTSVGYKRIYGKYVGVFYNHLVVAHFAEGTYSAVTGVADTYDQTTTPWHVGWSDLNNPDEFWATDINEADTYDVTSESLSNAAALGVTGMAGLNNQNYIYLSDEIWVMNYVGLPNVMQLESLNLKVGSLFQGGVVATPTGHYFISRDNICFFNGQQVQAIGNKVAAVFFTDVAPEGDSKRQYLFGTYDREKQEVLWTYWKLQNTGVYQCRQLVYIISKGDFFFRNLPSTQSGSHEIRAIERKYSQWQQLTYGGTAQLLSDAVGSVEDTQLYNAPFGVLTRLLSPADYTSANPGTAIKDAVDAAGTQTYTEPTIMTQDFVYDDAVLVKELDGLYLDADWIGCDGIQVLINNRNSIFGSAIVFNYLARFWNQTLPESALSLPRVSGKVFRYIFIFRGTQVVGAILRAWGELVYGKKKDIQK